MIVGCPWNRPDDRGIVPRGDQAEAASTLGTCRIAPAPDTYRVSVITESRIRQLITGRHDTRLSARRINARRWAPF